MFYSLDINFSFIKNFATNKLIKLILKGLRISPFCNVESTFCKIGFEKFIEINIILVDKVANIGQLSKFLSYV